MKKVYTLFFVALMIVSLTFLSVPVSAVTVNTHEAKLGDIVTYDIHAIACPTRVQAVDVSVYYDSTSLEYVEGSLKTPQLPGAVTNTTIPGEIRFNAITLDGFSFSEDGILASVEFVVTDDSADGIMIYYDVKNFIDEKKTELKDTYVYDITQVKDEKPSAEVSSQETVTSSKSEVSSSAVSSVVSSEAVQSEESEIVFDLSSSEDEASNASSIEDIPSDKAIRFDTLDTPEQDKSVTNRKYLTILLISLGIVILFAVFFVILLKDRGGKGSHFSE